MKKMRNEDFKTFDVPQNLLEVKLISDHFVCRCPITKVSDIYKIVVTYFPGNKILELYSFKKYLDEFIDDYIPMEVLSSMILDRLVTLIKPRKIEVRISELAPTEGTTIEAKSYWEEKGDSDR